MNRLNPKKMNWEYITLDDVVDKGSSNISLNKIKEDEGDYPIYSAKGFYKNISFYHQEKEYIAIIKDGAGIGRLSVHPPKSSVVGTMQYLIPKEGFDLMFVKYFLTGINFNLYKQGATIPHIYFKDYKAELVPKLSIEEQKRIAAKINGLFAKIDKAISLTEDSLKQAKNLFPSVLKEVFKNCEGDIMRLDEVSVIQPKKNEVKDLDCEVSFVPMKFLNAKKIDFIPESDKNISDVYKGYTYFQDKDVLLAKVIPCFQNGKSGVAKELTNGIGFGSSEFIVFRPNNFIVSEWLYYNITSPDFLSEGNNNMSGAVGLKRLTKSFVTEWKIKVPSLKKQKMYIESITKVSNQSKKTQSKFEEQLTYLKNLKSSILSKAFAGEL